MLLGFPSPFTPQIFSRNQIKSPLWNNREALIKDLVAGSFHRILARQNRSYRTESGCVEGWREGGGVCLGHVKKVGTQRTGSHIVLRPIRKRLFSQESGTIARSFARFVSPWTCLPGWETHRVSRLNGRATVSMRKGKGAEEPRWSLTRLLS